MRIVFFGNGIRGTSCFDTVASSHEVVAVVGHPGTDSTMVAKARDAGLQLYQPHRSNDPELIERLESLAPDLFVLAGYNRILKKPLLDIPRRGAINLHGGRLPEYRGVAPINWQIINGEQEGGCAILYVDEGIDTGDVIAQQTYPIAIDDDAAVIVSRTVEIFRSMLPSVLRQIEEGTATRGSQDESRAVYYTRRYPRDGRIRWRELSAMQAHNLARALVRPYPGAFCFHGETKITLGKTALLEEEIRGVPGRVALFRGDDAAVIASDRGLLVKEIFVGDHGEPQAPRRYFGSIGEDLS